MPSKIQFRNGNKTEYLYDAMGVKREAKYSFAMSGIQIPLGATARENTDSILSTSHTDYCGNYIYENDTLKRILTSEGYIQTAAGANPVNNMESWKYTYFLKDHLGNTRAQLACNNISNTGSTAYTVAGVTDYYPFGMEISAPEGNLTSGTNPYLYNGKEMDRMNGLNMYDYGARWYDQSRWMRVDPHAERYYSISPYVYCMDNPVRLIDPNGMDPYLVYDGKTKTLKIYDDNKTSGNYKDDKLLGTFKAQNNVDSKSKGKWEDGKYEMQDKKERATHDGKYEKDGKTPQDSKNGGYGEGGIYRAKPFKETTTGNTRKGMAVHAGREYKDFEKRVTMGCVRTTPEAMNAID